MSQAFEICLAGFLSKTAIGIGELKAKPNELRLKLMATVLLSINEDLKDSFSPRRMLLSSFIVRRYQKRAYLTQNFSPLFIICKSRKTGNKKIKSDTKIKHLA